MASSSSSEECLLAVDDDTEAGRVRSRTWLLPLLLLGWPREPLGEAEPSLLLLLPPWLGWGCWWWGGWWLWW